MELILTNKYSVHDVKQLLFHRLFFCLPLNLERGKRAVWIQRFSTKELELIILASTNATFSPMKKFFFIKILELNDELYIQRSSLVGEERNTFVHRPRSFHFLQKKWVLSFITVYGEHGKANRFQGKIQTFATHRHHLFLCLWKTSLINNSIFHFH